MKPRRTHLLALAVLGLAGLAACQQQDGAPTDRGVCWHRAPQPEGGFKFNRVASDVDTVEKCAAELEGMRMRFLGLGGSNTSIVGAYQGQYLFLQREGIFVGKSLTGGRYLLLVRAGNGQLAKPGVLPVE